MTKKFLSALLAMILLFSTAALAEGKLKVTDKNLFIFPGENTGYFYAKVENVGDAPAGIDSGNLVIFSEDDEILLSKSYITTLPNYVILDAGDYLYIKEFLWDNSLKNVSIGDYKLSIPTTKRNRTVSKLPCEATFDLTDTDGFNNYVYVTFTNTTEEVLHNLYIVAALYDTEGTLIFVDSASLSSISVHPNSTITVEIYVDRDLMDYYAANGITPAAVDAMVCITNE